MYNLTDLLNNVTYCNWRIGMVFNGTENYRLSHNHNIVNFISNRWIFPIAHPNFQSPRPSGRPLNAHPKCLQGIMLTKADFVSQGFNCIYLNSHDIGGESSHHIHV